MIKWSRSILCVLFIFVVEICANVAIAQDTPSKDMTSKWKKSEQELEEKAPEALKKVEHQVKRVLIYSRANCESCDEAKDQLKRRNIEFQHVDLTWNRKQSMILSRKAGKEDTSYVFIGNEYIGNHEDLKSMLHKGRLLKILEGEK